MASVAAESLESHLLAAGETQEDDVKILVGREAIVAAHGDLLERPSGRSAPSTSRRTSQARPDVTVEALQRRAGVAGPGARTSACACVYHPGFDPDRLTELGLFAARASSPGPRRCR